MCVYTYTRGCASHSPAVSQNQLGGEWNLLYNNYHLITLIYSIFLQFLCQFKMRYHATTCFVEISCVHARLHAHVNLHITYNNIQATHLRAHIHN